MTLNVFLPKFEVLNNIKTEKMENKEFRFKTTLNCGGCVSKVESDLDNHEGVCHWSVDTANADKILTVSSKGIDAEEVIALIKNKGFKAESLPDTVQI